MLVYWLIFLFLSLAALTQPRSLHGLNGLSGERWSFLWVLCWISLMLIIGLRHEVGGDWNAYLAQLDAERGENFSDLLFKQDLAYSFLNWIGANFWGGIYLVNTFCAAIFTWGLLLFCRMQPRPWLALLVAVPFLILVVGMGYTRQAAAIGLIMVGLIRLHQGRTWYFILWVAIAALFHKSALILTPIAIFSQGKYRFTTLIGVLAFAGLLFLLLLQDHIENLYLGYIVDEYNSRGAAVRLFMNVLPALLFLIFKNKFYLSARQLKLWTWVAASALGCLVLLIFVPSSTAVDRIAIYFIPVQLFVFSRFPDVFKKSGNGRSFLVYCIVGYCAAVQIVWLFFGEHASLWLPYRFYPWELLWS
jgi:hypothetical protein